MIVRFATLCDHCGKRSEEYTAWPTCRECFEDTCPECDSPSHRSDDEANQTLCRHCEAIELTTT